MRTAQQTIPSADTVTLCAGKGQYHTDSNNRNGPLLEFTLPQIRLMLNSPDNCEKSTAPWFIPSSLISRNKQRQINDGLFYALWADLDDMNLEPWENLPLIIGDLTGNAEALIYTSKSATDENPKSRVIIPLAESISGAEFERSQRALNDKLAAAGIEPDRATESANQICYLPNRGEVYRHHISEGGLFSLSGWSVEIDALKQLEAVAEEARKAKMAAARAKFRQRMASGQKSPVDAFNAAYDVETLLETFGYRKRGNRWLSPNSESGSPGVDVKGNRWKTNHQGDLNAGLPKSGDTFDLLVHFQHGGNFNEALQAVGEQFTTPDGLTITKHNQVTYMRDRAVKHAEEDFTKAIDNDANAEQAVDLFNVLELPHFPLNLLPRAIADYAKDQAELIGVDPAVIAMAAIGAAAACIDDRLNIQPKKHDTGWLEQPRLWVGIIGDPSAKKSPGISKAMGPLFNINKEWREESERARAEWLEACESTPKGGEKPPKPIGKRLILNDATVEKMGDILSECEPRGILSYQDELSGWLASMDAYKNGAGGKDKAAWLEAYNGGHKAIDRVGRGSTFVENWSACVLGGIQPSVVQSYANTTNHDGMLQRFVLVQAGEARLGADRRPDTEAKERYYRLMEGLAALGVVGCPVVTLSDDAHKAREALEEKLHGITISHPNKYLCAALGKWSGLYARLLLVFHCIDCVNAGEHPTFCEVSGRTAQNTADLLWRTLLPHAIKFYNGLDPTEDDARALAALILARGWERFTVKRDLSRYWRASRKLKPWELEETLDRLEAFSWISPEAGKVNERGKPSVYLVNPNVHTRFSAIAKKERERRKEVASMMAELSR